MPDQRRLKAQPGAGRSASLSELPVPTLLAEQLQRFTINSMRVRRVRPFDASVSLSVLRECHGETVIAIDISGAELSASYFTVRDGAVERTEDILAYQDDGGASYLTALRELSALARRDGLRVGVSVAGPVSGTRLLDAPNLPGFAAQFRTAFGCDFTALFDDVQVANDAEAGVMACALEAARRFSDTRDVLHVVNRVGLGGAVLTGGWIYAAEPGHVRVTDQLNALGQRRECGIDGARYACIEGVAGGKAGIEDMWTQQKRPRLSVREISALYLAGDHLARQIYDVSARLMAHVIAGMAEAFGLAADPAGLTVVGQGAVFDVPGYSERVSDILAHDDSPSLRILFARDFSSNTCLEGAAVEAAISLPT